MINIWSGIVKGSGNEWRIGIGIADTGKQRNVRYVVRCLTMLGTPLDV